MFTLIARMISCILLHNFVNADATMDIRKQYCVGLGGKTHRNNLTKYFRIAFNRGNYKVLCARGREREYNFKTSKKHYKQGIFQVISQHFNCLRQ